MKIDPILYQACKYVKAYKNEVARVISFPLDYRKIDYKVKDLIIHVDVLDIKSFSSNLFTWTFEIFYKDCLIYSGPERDFDDEPNAKEVEILREIMKLLRDAEQVNNEIAEEEFLNLTFDK